MDQASQRQAGDQAAAEPTWLPSDMTLTKCNAVGPVRVCSVVSNFFVTPGTVAHQAPLSMGFPRQEYWSG